MGAVTIENIESVVGDVEVAGTGSIPKAPGQLKSHYAPSKKMFIAELDKAIDVIDMDRVALLSFKKDYQAKHQAILSPSGDLAEAAKNLFDTLRQLDKMPVELILAELVPEEGIGRAINDRLRRASAK